MHLWSPTASDQDPSALTSGKKTWDVGRLVRLTFRDGGLILGCEESTVSLLLLTSFVPVIVLGLTRRPVVFGERLRYSSRDRWSRKVPRIRASNFLVRPSIASSTFR